MIHMVKSELEPHKWSQEFTFWNFTDPVKFSKNNIHTSLHGIGFLKNNFFYGTIADELWKLHECGIIGKIMQNDLDKRRRKEVKAQIYGRKKTEVLSWDHLYAGFYLWIGACVISALVFFGEILKNLFSRHLEDK